jgi:hypothetical protein
MLIVYYRISLVCSTHWELSGYHYRILALDFIWFYINRNKHKLVKCMKKSLNLSPTPRGKTASGASHISSTDKTKGWNGCDKYHTRNRESEEMHRNVILKAYTERTTWMSRFRWKGTMWSKVWVYLNITIQKVTINVQSVPRQSPHIYWHVELCSRRPCSV